MIRDFGPGVTRPSQGSALLSLGLLIAQSMSGAGADPRPAPERANEAEKVSAVKPAFPDPSEVAAAMKKAATFYRRDLAFAGGYAWKWSEGRGTARTEGRESPSVIGMQPPGTPSVGLVMVKAFRATGDPLYLQAAREAAGVLMWCQLSSGGWDSDFDFDPRFARKYHFRRDLDAGEVDRGGRRSDSTLDDQKTQSALLFILELAHVPECSNDGILKGALRFGMDGLLAAQAPNGGWGQHYDGPADASAPVCRARMPDDWPRIWPGVDYTRFYTLNDDNILWVIDLLLRAHELEKDPRFLDAAKRAGDFLLLARFDEPQPVWAQQYNRDMEPVWARKFEPTAVCSVESIGALKALIELWLATGDEKYIAPHPAAFAWFERSKLPDGQWARFYELKTNRPIYCRRDSYELTYDDSDLPTHYGFKVGDLSREIERLKKEMASGREEILRRRALPADPKKWASRAKGQVAKVTAALEAAGDRGYWLKDGWIDAAEFVRHMQAMITYVEAAKRGGEAFEAMRAKAAIATGQEKTR
ncbi:MAG TPA: pectate lyase [Verrucomicrobiae bacterium]|nr:pectate lyase [Verrucomicrobiae bacterium]